jgi:hypothetical protein
MRAAFVALILTAGSLVAEEEKLLVCELIQAFRGYPESGYKLRVTNISKEKLYLCAEKTSMAGVPSRPWSRTDLYVSTSVPGPRGIFPAYYAKTPDNHGKMHDFGANHIRTAIQNPTGDESSFCELDPGQSIACEDPVFPTKPERATFHFLGRRDGKMVPIQGEWSIDQSPSALWEGVTRHPIPKGDPGRIGTYRVPVVIKENRQDNMAIVSDTRPIFDLKPWCVRNGLNEADIDFAFYDPATGLCLISTSQANRLKLKELHFETH